VKATVKENFDDYVGAHGPLQDLPWETLDGRKMTVGTMSDEHVQNCITHHQKIVNDNEPDDGYNPVLMSCRVIVMIMQEEQKRRAAL